MGPSGSGKTTLINMIVGRLSNNKAMKISGEILINK